jgi:hypothetical protein
MEQSGEVSEGRLPAEYSLEAVLADLDKRLELASQEYIAEGLTAKAEEHYRGQIEGLLAYIARLQMEKASLEARVQTLEARIRRRPWTRGDEGEK